MGNLVGGALRTSKRIRSFRLVYVPKDVYHWCIYTRYLLQRKFGTMAESTELEPIKTGIVRSPLRCSIRGVNDLKIEDAIRQKLEDCKELNIVIIGCYEVGKSTLINSIFFKRGKEYKEEAKEGAYKPETKTVSPYTLELDDGVKCYIYDSPGLRDGIGDDLDYLAMIKAKCRTVHLIIYCTKMPEPARPGEVAALRTVTETFGKEIWKNAVIALTFADTVAPVDPEEDLKDYFSKKKGQKIEDLRDVFINKLSIEEHEVGNIMKHAYATGTARMLKLPGMTQDWRVDFWQGCLEACRSDGQGALLKIISKGYVVKVVVASASTTSGTVAVMGGVGCMAAGATFTVTGVLAPLGIPLMISGAVATLLGVGTTVSGAKSLNKAHKQYKLMSRDTM